MEYQYAKVGIIAGILIISGSIIWLVLANSEAEFEDELFEYENVSQKQCFEYYNGMWNRDRSSCLSDYPTGLIPCIDTSLSKAKNNGVFYCDPKDVDIKPDELFCDFDVYDTRYCLIKET